MLNKKKILITGGSGFIGKNLKEYLSNSYEVLAPTHKELELVNEKEVDNFFRNNKIDVVVHSANFGGKRNQKDCVDVVKQNLKMFFNITNNAEYFKKMIFLGSGAEYSQNRDISKIKESDFGKNIPEEDYGLYKYICSKFIEKSEKIVNLRLFSVFGKYEDYEIRFISNIICRAIFNLPIETNRNRVMEYVFIEDLCKIVEYFINNEAKRRFYNIGTGKHFDLITLANKIRKISGKNLNIVIKNKGMDKEYTCDNSALKNELKDFKFTDIDKGIKILYQWYESNKGKINKENLLEY